MKHSQKSLKRHKQEIKTLKRIELTLEAIKDEMLDNNLSREDILKLIHTHINDQIDNAHATKKCIKTLKREIDAV